MSLRQMTTDLAAAAERYRANNPPEEREPPRPRIEDHLVIVHVTHPQPPTRSPDR